jgi:membrane protease YdiL (CAAX protease family)
VAKGSSRNELVAYTVIAFALSWSIGVPLALARQGVLPQILPPWTHYLIGYGPALGAVIVTGFAEGRPGLRRLAARIVRWRVGSIWWLAAAAPLLVAGLAALALLAIGGPAIHLADIGHVHFLPPMGFAVLPLWLLTFGLGEETGWRGFALPRLQRGRSALAATVILASIWAVWHLPQFFYLFEAGMALGWLVGLFAGAIVFTWLFNSSGGSVLIVAVFHGCFNVVTSSTAGSGTLAAVVSIAVMVWAVFVVVYYGPKQLSGERRVLV